MTHHELSDAVQTWNAGDRVRLTFLRGAGRRPEISDEQHEALAYLVLGDGKQDVEFTDPNHLSGEQASGYWGNDHCRIAEAIVLNTMNIRSFVKNTYAALESVEVISA